MKSLRALLNKDLANLEVPAPMHQEKLKFTAAGVERLLDVGQERYPERNWPATKLYASGLGYTSPGKFVYQYFDHVGAATKFSANVQMSMAAGTAIHEFIQSRLMLANVLHPKSETSHYKEPRFEDKELRIVSKIDGLVDEQQLADFGKKDTKVDFDEARPLTLDLLEMKLVNSHTYKNTKMWSDISLPYRLQATATQKISGYPRTIFMFIDRADFSFRFIPYKAEEDLWVDIKKLSKTTFTHLRELTRPEDFLDDWLIVNGVKLSWDQFVRFHIDRQKGRKWLHDSTCDDVSEYSGAFIIG
jgi:hypothetical protein